MEVMCLLVQGSVAEATIAIISSMRMAEAEAAAAEELAQQQQQVLAQVQVQAKVYKEVSLPIVSIAPTEP